MTNAYFQGFCKTAEAYGVDPVALTKVAAPLMIRPLTKAMSNPNIRTAVTNKTLSILRRKGLIPSFKETMAKLEAAAKSRADKAGLPATN